MEGPLMYIMGCGSAGYVLNPRTAPPVTSSSSNEMLSSRDLFDPSADEIVAAVYEAIE